MTTKCWIARKAIPMIAFAQVRTIHIIYILYSCVTLHEYALYITAKIKLLK